MRRSLAIQRSSATSKLLIPVVVFNPETEHGAQFMGQLDTGNDHTCISRSVVEALGINEMFGELVVHGVNGSETAGVSVVTLAMMFDGSHPVTINRHEVGVVAALNDCHLLLGRDLLGVFDVEIRRNGLVVLTV